MTVGTENVILTGKLHHLRVPYIIFRADDPGHFSFVFFINNNLIGQYIFFHHKHFADF